jgi:hypothetical protein
MKLQRCPSKNTIIRLLEEQVTDAEGWKHLAHVATCPICLTVFEAAKEIRSQSDKILRGLDGLDLKSRETQNRLRIMADQEIRLLRRGRRMKRWNAFRWIGIPAAGAAMILLTTFVIVPALRTHRGSVVERNLSLLKIDLLQPKGTIPAAAFSFKWTSQPEIQSYRLEIYDQSLVLVYQSDPIHSDNFTLPANIMTKILKDKIYFWKIVGNLKDNQTIESEFARFIPQR